MNSLNILLPYNYVSSLVNLTWSDILFGIEQGFLTQDAAIEHAINLIGKEQEPSGDISQLAYLDKGESVHPYIDELARQISEHDHNIAQEKFLFVLLNWIFEYKELYSDPLEAVEYIYSDFDYPEVISEFVRYMPTNQPVLDSLELNRQRLFNNWKDYLEKQKARFSAVD